MAARTFVHEQYREVYGLHRGDGNVVGDFYETPEAAQRAADALAEANRALDFKVWVYRLNLGDR